MGDLISRDDTLKIIADTFFLYGTNSKAEREIISLISRMPSAEKKGKWIGISDGYADGYPVYDEWECSCCGVIEEDEEPTWNYCPNCGAKMEMME